MYTPNHKEVRVQSSVVVKRIVLFLVVFFLPFQLGYHFWLPETYVKSFRIDYLAPTLYLTDIFILLFLVLNHKIILDTVRSFLSSLPGWIFVFLIILNLWTSSFSSVTAFAWLKMIEYLLLLIVLSKTEKLGEKIVTPFSLSLGIIILLAVVQFVTQSSVGGPFYLLGERPLSLALPNIAKVSHLLPALPEQILRPYSTFSHPNSLAGFLLVSFVILSLTIKKKTAKVPLALTILLTFSKAALFSFVVIEVMEFGLIQSIFVSLALSLAPLAKDLVFIPSWLAQSFSARHYLLLPSVKIIADRFFLGVGLRQFIPNLSNYLPGNQLSYLTLQPVHNTFLLMLAEFGLVGIILAVVVFWSPLAKIIKNKKTRPYLTDLAGIILMTGSLDHYWWTLPQNQLIIVLTLALIINKHNELSGDHH